MTIIFELFWKCLVVWDLNSVNTFQWNPVTPYHVHFIFRVTSYRRENVFTTSHVHLIPGVTSYFESLHTRSHFIPLVTSYYGSLHIRSHFIPLYFIPSALHTKSLHIMWTSYQATLYKVTSYQVHFIPSAFHIKSLHTKCIQGHFIQRAPYIKTLDTKLLCSKGFFM